MVSGPKHAGQLFLCPLTPRVKVKPLNQLVEKTFPSPHAGHEAGDTLFPERFGVLQRGCGDLSQPGSQGDFLLAWAPSPCLGPFLCPLLPWQSQSTLPVRATDRDQSEDPGSPVPRVCCPFKGMVTANTGYWRVGAAGLGNQPEVQFRVNCSGIPAMGFLQALHSSRRFSR